MALKAVAFRAADRSNKARDLAYGLQRTVADAHPLLAKLAARPAQHGLTPKERAVLELLARYLSHKEIAQELAVGEETVKWHIICLPAQAHRRYNFIGPIRTRLKRKNS